MFHVLKTVEEGQTLGILQECLPDYQGSVKSAKSAFLSNMISSNSCKPWFKKKDILNSVVSIEASSVLCDHFFGLLR